MKQWQANAIKVVLETVEMLNSNNLAYAQSYIKEILDGDKDKYLDIEVYDIIDRFGML